MPVIGKSILGLAGLGAYLGLAAATLSAQHISFSLPVEARVGRAVLEPGQYTLRFPTAADTLRVVAVSGNGKTVNILPQVTTYNANIDGKGELTLVDVDGNYRIASITDSIGNRAFSFPVPKSHETKSNSQLPQQQAPQHQAKIAVQVKANS